MADCTEFPTAQGAKDFATNSQVFKEVMTETGERTTTAATDGQTKLTLAELNKNYVNRVIGSFGNAGLEVTNGQQSVTDTVNGGRWMPLSTSYPIPVPSVNPQDSSWYQVSFDSLQDLSGLDMPSDLDNVYDRKFSTVSDMIAYNGHSVGFTYTTGNTIWEVASISSPMAISNFIYKTIPDSRDFGLIYEDQSEASNNTSKLVSSGVDAVFINVVSDLYLEPLPINDTSLTLNHVKISGDKAKSLFFTSGGTMFVVAEGGSFYQNLVSVENLSSEMIEVVTTKRLSNTRIKALVCKDSNLKGYVRYGIGLADSATQDPNVKTNGADTIDFSNNNLTGCDYGELWLINVMYDSLIVDNNHFTDCKGAIIDNSVQNSTTNYEVVKSFKKSAKFTDNTLINNLDFFSDSDVTGNVYAVIALSEGNYAWYDGNYCKNLQVKESQSGSCNDFYYADEKSEIGKNTIVNRFHWGPQAQSNPFVNCCLKIKKAKNWSCTVYDHFYDEDYFDYQIANNGVSLTDIQGDFLAIEHSVADGPANIINVDGVRLYSRVLKDAKRNLFRCQNFTVVNGEFYSPGAGFTEMCRAIADDSVISDFYKSCTVSDNKFLLPNATLTLVTVTATASQSIDVSCSRNTGEVLNLDSNSIGQSGSVISIRRYEQDDNNISVTGVSAGLISKDAVMPVMSYMSLNNNVITAPAATDIDSLFGGVTSTAVNASATCRFTTGLSTAIPLDTITGKDAAQPMQSQDGLRIIKGVLYDTDFVNFGKEYPFTITYAINATANPYTRVTFNNESDAFSSARSDQVSTTSLKVDTTHPNMSGEVTSGVVGANVIQITITFGAGSSTRVVDVEMIKVS